VTIISKADRITFGCTLPKELLDQLDEQRGLIPRTKYIECLVRDALDAKAKVRG
jgi:hypothetical protein